MTSSLAYGDFPRTLIENTFMKIEEPETILDIPRSGTDRGAAASR